MQVMKAWLESIVVFLQEKLADSPEKQLVSAVCIAYCFNRCIKSSHPQVDKFILPLLRMLHIKENQVYLYLCEVLPRESRYAQLVRYQTLNA